jgi:hypothetical protein
LEKEKNGSKRKPTRIVYQQLSIWGEPSPEVYPALSPEEVDHPLNKVAEAPRPLFMLPPENQPRPHGESDVYLIGSTTQGEALVREFERWTAYYQAFNAAILEVATPEAGAADGGVQQIAMFDLFTHAEEMAARPDLVADIPTEVLAHFWVESGLPQAQERAARLTLYACAMQAYAEGVSRFKRLPELVAPLTED